MLYKSFNFYLKSRDQGVNISLKKIEDCALKTENVLQSFFQWYPFIGLYLLRFLLYQSMTKRLRIK
jgi:hypothetical protein